MADKKQQQQPPQNKPTQQEPFARGDDPLRDPSALPIADIARGAAEMAAAEDAAYAARRPTADDIKGMAKRASEDLSPKELELLAAELLKRAGKAGKSPTGRHIVKHRFMRDPTEEHPTPRHVLPFRRVEQEDGSFIEERVILGDLTDAEVKHLTKHGAIEPEYA